MFSWQLAIDSNRMNKNTEINVLFMLNIFDFEKNNFYSVYANFTIFPRLSKTANINKTRPLCSFCMDFERILSVLPDYNFAITYGSGVFRQKGYSDKDVKNAMLDVIIGVEDPESWHKLNLKQNSKHYSSLRILGPKNIGSIEVNDILFD